MTDIIEGRDDFDSVLGRLDNPVGGTIALTLTVKTYIQLVAPGSFHFEATLPVPGNPSQTSLQPQTLTVSQAPPDALSQFQQRFADTIDHAWNGKLWLVHGGTTRQRSDGSRIYNVRCRVRIQYVSQPEAQLIMQLLWQPTGNGATTFRQNCHRGGIGRPHGGIRDALRNAMGLNANPRDMQLLDDSCGERTLHFPASDCSTNGCTTPRAATPSSSAWRPTSSGTTSASRTRAPRRGW